MVKTVPMSEVSVALDGHIPIFFCAYYKLLCLEVEPCDDTRINDASGVLHNSSDVFTDSVVPVTKQVNDFISDGFLGRRFVKQFVLCYRSVVCLSVCLSVSL